MFRSSNRLLQQVGSGNYRNYETQGHYQLGSNKNKYSLVNDNVRVNNTLTQRRRERMTSEAVTATRELDLPNRFHALELEGDSLTLFRPIYTTLHIIYTVVQT